MIAYDETYLSGAQRRLGAMIDMGVNGCGIELARFYLLFLQDSLSVRFCAGDPAIIAGRSGEELALEVLAAHGGSMTAPIDWAPRSKASAEYWTGWALAFYQWASTSTFQAIERLVSIDQVITMYRPFHEMDIRQFCDKMDELCVRARPRTNVQEARVAAGLSQSQLAAASGVPVRTLQQYEQRQKDINHARADYVEALARVLCCNASDLLERRADIQIEYASVKL